MLTRSRHWNHYSSGQWPTYRQCMYLKTFKHQPVHKAIGNSTRYSQKFRWAHLWLHPPYLQSHVHNCRWYRNRRGWFKKQSFYYYIQRNIHTIKNIDLIDNKTNEYNIVYNAGGILNSSSHIWTRTSVHKSVIILTQWMKQEKIYENRLRRIAILE